LIILHSYLQPNFVFHYYLFERKCSKIALLLHTNRMHVSSVFIVVFPENMMQCLVIVSVPATDRATFVSGTIWRKEMCHVFLHTCMISTRSGGDSYMLKIGWILSA
jgi:hypothetical protein